MGAAGWSMVLLPSILAGLLVLIVVWMRQVEANWGRLLFPALGAITVLIELPIRNEPMPAPPMMIISCGPASRTGSRLPPAKTNPPNTMPKTTIMPMI